MYRDVILHNTHTVGMRSIHNLAFHSQVKYQYLYHYIITKFMIIAHNSITHGYYFDFQIRRYLTKKVITVG